MAALGCSPMHADALTEEDLQLLRYVAAVLSPGCRWWPCSSSCASTARRMAQVADAEVQAVSPVRARAADALRGRRDGDGRGDAATSRATLLPLASPVMDQVHQRYLQHFVEQDVVGHMESDLDGEALDLGRMRVAIAFADLAGYTRLTEEEGELRGGGRGRAVRGGGREHPPRRRPGDQDDRRRGDDRRLGPRGADRLGGRVPAAARAERPLPRIGIHYGDALYRDGDYYGRDVNIASRVAARSAGGEVLVTRPVVERAARTWSSSGSPRSG